MAKRALGLGQKNKEKKRKVDNATSNENKESPTPGAEQLQIEVDENADLDDELVQLKGLWDKYFHSDREGEYVLNGIVHECDRLLREADKDENAKSLLNDKFHAIYALALSELTIFKAAEEGEDISQYFENALERVQVGLESTPESDFLKLVMAKIIIQRIPLQFVSKLNVKSKAKDVSLDLFEQLQTAQKNFNSKANLELGFEVLQMFDDLLDILENFGLDNNVDEGLDSDEEDELELVVLEKSHPLYRLQQAIPESYAWLRENMRKLLAQVEDPTLRRNVARSLGHLFLKAAEGPSSLFLQQYDEEAAGDVKEAKKAQKKALSYTRSALDYLEKAQVEDEPETWVEVAEAYIDLGNLHGYQSAEQEKAYQVAEEILKRANKASHGKFQDILDNLSTKE